MIPHRADASEDSDDELDWEEVVPYIPQQTTVISGDDGESTPAPDLNLSTNELNSLLAQPSNDLTEKRIEITLKQAPSEKGNERRKLQSNEIARLRSLRLTCHKLHTVTLLSNALTRNKWINDTLLHARLLSLVPLSLQNSFTTITKKNYPEAAKRGRVFETAIMRLSQWWCEDFFKIEPYGHIRSRTFDQVQKILHDFNYNDEDGEIVRSSKSLMKHALNRRGSKDISAQLFTALCRALNIPARLVVSLQSVPWNASAGKVKSSPTKKGGRDTRQLSDPSEGEVDEDEDEDADTEELEASSTRNLKSKGKMDSQESDQTLTNSHLPTNKGKGKVLPKPVINLRKSRPKGQRLGSASDSQSSTSKTSQYPVFWTEVFSRPDGKWISVDPIRYIVNKRKMFEPPSNDSDNRLIYVVAVEEDGYCRDVTPRYARDYGTRTSKMQLGGKSRGWWWESIMAYVTRPYRLLRDDVEDEEFEYNKFTEGMPTSVAGFKNHPLYILEQHLKREEIIHPKIEIGKFRGEPVYPRSNIITLKTAENWMRMGRRIKEGAQALKWVKQRAVTVHRRRAMELAQQEGEETLQGLYSEEQTELYIPEPVIDGIIPKNDFGNIDLYAPTMLPKGASHIPHKGIAKIAKKLGFDYAEAVTSFEFKKGRAFPVVTGVVVAVENEETLLEAYWEAEREAEQKEQIKKKERIFKRWAKLIHGLRIRQRLQAQYAGGGNNGPPSQLEITTVMKDTHLDEQPGGFLTDINSVIQPFQLPRYEHVIHESTEAQSMEKGLSSENDADVDPPSIVFSPNNMGADGDDSEEEIKDFEEISSEIPDQNKQWVKNSVPISLLELAENRAAQQRVNTKAADVDRGEQLNSEDGTYDHTHNIDPMMRSMKSNGNGGPKSATMPRLRMKRSETSRVAAPRGRNRKRNKIRDEDLASSSTSDVSEQLVNDSDGDADDMDYENGGDSSIDSGRKGKKSRSRRTDASGPNLKRKRFGGAPTAVVSTTPSPSTRVLRTRAPKSAEKIQAEKEAEAAFRKAIAR